jgi:hypothetical protein
MGVESALLTTAVIGAGISAYGSYREGQDAKEASLYNANVARTNAEMNATMIEQSGALDASRQRKSISRLIGTQKAGFAGAGVELTGSPLDVMINTAAEGELDAQIIEHNTKASALSARYGGASQAAYDEKMAGIYERSGNFRAGSTLLKAGAEIGSGYLSSKKTSTKTSTDGQIYTGGKIKTGDYSIYRGY